MGPRKKQQVVETIQIAELTTDQLAVCLIGRSPLLMNAMSEKVQQGLLLPDPPKSRATKAATLKHDPLTEYRNSIYAAPITSTGATRILMPSVAFKKALTGAALDIPGAATKAQLGRLIWVEGDYTEIYGVPQMLTMPVRNGDIARTPDIRTRAILPRWACYLTISFITPILKRPSLVNLLAAAGMIRGIGDARSEKGTFNYGQFRIVAQDDADFKDIVSTGGVTAQDAALESPTFYDEETRRLIRWFEEQVALRGLNAITRGEEDDGEEDRREAGNGRSRIDANLGEVGMRHARGRRQGRTQSEITTA